MGASYRPAFPPAGGASYGPTQRRKYRGGVSGPSYDPDAAAYIDATGELFPDALNTLVLGIKAAGLWGDHIGSIKKAIGVPNLAASMVDLRNPSFAGTPVNSPTHSATEGWGFTAASSQYIDSGWQCGATDSKGSQDSVHIGFRIMAHSAGFPGSVDPATAQDRLGFEAFGAGIQRWFGNTGTTAQGSQNPAVPGHYIGVRSGAAAQTLYRDGASVASNTAASTGVAAVNYFIGCRHRSGPITDQFLTGRISLWHAGAVLDATQQATLEGLFDAYATAAGEV